MVEAAKCVFLEEAAREIERGQEKVNISRLAAMSGMHRRDVMRIYRDEGSVDAAQGLITRIIGQWQQDRRFCTRNGKPRILSFEGPNSDFKRLVSHLSNDLNPATVYFELERTGAVVRTRDGVKLVTRAYVPKGNMKAGFELLANDMDDLVRCVEGNLIGGSKTPHLHGKTEYDNISADAADEIRAWLLREGSALHQKARNFLARFDFDTNSRLKRTGKRIRVALATFAFSELSDKD